MEGYQNIYCLMGLLGLVGLAFHANATRKPHEAALYVIFGAFLFGPEGAFLKFPLMPPLDKATLPAAVFFAAAFLRHGSRIQKSGIFTPTPDILLVVGFVGAVMTALTNGDPLTYGSWIVNHIPGMNVKDALNNAIADLFEVSFVFLMGRYFFREPVALNAIYRFLMGAGLLMIPFIMWELRFSPNLHWKVYGFAAIADFLQTLRWGGYRPNVFTQHGLALAIFMFSSWYLSLLTHRLEPGKFWRSTTKVVHGALLVFLILCKSTGAILWALLFGPLAWRSKPKVLQRAATICALVAFFYPVMRSTDTFPVTQVVGFANAVSPERGQSVEFRFDNEDLLLNKARERLAFGWGTYGRHTIYHEEIGDKDIAIADGYWIIRVSMGGVAAFIYSFGLLVWPVLMMGGVLGRVKDPVLQAKVAGLSLLVAILTLELLPNGLFSNWSYLLAGALAGFAQDIKKNPSAWQRPEGGPGWPMPPPGYPLPPPPRPGISDAPWSPAGGSPPGARSGRP